MNRKMIVIFSFIFLILLSGCATRKNKVKLLDKNQVFRYAKTRFSNSSYKGIESQTDDRIDYIFVDNEYKFEYIISSYIAKDINLGGEESGLYEERTESDYGGKYYEYIISSLEKDVEKLEKKYNVSIKNNDGRKDIFNYINSNTYLSGLSPCDCLPYETAFYSIYSKDYLSLKDNKTKAGNELAALVKKIDKRKYFTTCSIWIRDDKKNSDGVYSAIQNILLKED